MSTEIGEAINVVAVFDSGIKPVKFKWKGVVYPVREITYTWRTNRGAASIVHFSVTDGATLYEITYNASTMRWTLEQVE